MAEQAGSAMAERAAHGGGAVSVETLDDTLNPTPSLTINASNTVHGGGGGAGNSGASGGAAGLASATTTVTGVAGSGVTSYVYAYGGNGGANGGSGAIDGASGNASAISNATGTDITSKAYAYGGASHVGDGTAAANASGAGADGTVHAESYSNYNNVANGMLVTYTNAIADAPVSGTSAAQTQAGIGATSAAFTTGAQSIAKVMGVPTPANVTSVLSANSNISAAFTSKVTPDYFAIGELGGAYSTNDTEPETETASIHMGVDLTKITPKDLILGLYSGTETGSGFTSMTFDVKANGTDILNKTFTSSVGGDDILHQRRARSRPAFGLRLDAQTRYLGLDYRGADRRFRLWDAGR